MATTTRASFLVVTVVACLAALVSASTAGATTIELSQLSSEANPGPAVLKATLVFMVTGANELTLTATNGTTTPDNYLIDGLWWNAGPNVTGLSLVSATHSQAGDVTAAWSPVETNSHVAGFGSFDFGLTVPSNANRATLIDSGENVSFVFTIAGTGPFEMGDFDVQNDKGVNAAAKFVSGPGDLSAFGAVPEPATATLLGVGLLGLGLGGRRR
jgi:hypothetical protein